MAKERDYAKEYREYHSRPEQKKNRAARNKARRLMIKERGRAAVRGKDVDHKNGNPRDNRRSNRQLLSIRKNRGKH